MICPKKTPTRITRTLNLITQDHGNSIANVFSPTVLQPYGGFGIKNDIPYMINNHPLSPMRGYVLSQNLSTSQKLSNRYKDKFALPPGLR